MTRCLLDVNVLVALIDPSHIQHDRAHDWFAAVGKHAGKDLANPTALLQSAILMLRYIGEIAAADRVQSALEKVYIAKKSLTRDVGGTSGTKAFTAASLAAI